MQPLCCTRLFPSSNDSPCFLTFTWPTPQNCRYALKLLGALLEFNRAWVAEVAAAGLAGRCAGVLTKRVPWAAVGTLAGTLPLACLEANAHCPAGGGCTHTPTSSLRVFATRRFFEWLSIAHPHNNVHNLRLCRLVAEAKVLPAQALASLEAIDRVRPSENERACRAPCACAKTHRAPFCLLCPCQLLSPGAGCAGVRA